MPWNRFEGLPIPNLHNNPLYLEGGQRMEEYDGTRLRIEEVHDNEVPQQGPSVRMIQAGQPRLQIQNISHEATSSRQPRIKIEEQEESKHKTIRGG